MHLPFFLLKLRSDWFLLAHLYVHVNASLFASNLAQQGHGKMFEIVTQRNADNECHMEIVTGTVQIRFAVVNEDKDGEVGGTGY